MNHATEKRIKVIRFVYPTICIYVVRYTIINCGTHRIVAKLSKVIYTLTRLRTEVHQKNASSQ